MTAAVLHFETRIEREVPVESGATIDVISATCWDSSDASRKAKKTRLAVEGELSERGATWREKWIFEWPAETVEPLESALTPIWNFVRMRGPISKEREVHADVFEWLRIGWIDYPNGTWKGYVRFAKDGRFLTSYFKDMPHLSSFRDVLKWEMNG